MSPLFDVARRLGGSGSLDPEAEELPPVLLTLEYLNEALAHEGLRLIKVEKASSEDARRAYVLVRLDGREISPPRIYGLLWPVVWEFFPHGI